MKTSENLYWILAILALAGYAWIGFHLVFPASVEGLTVCLFKNATGIPCPSCGITRSVVFFMGGNFQHAAFINPLGLLAALFMVVLPAWIVYDLVTRKKTLPHLFLWIERKIKTKKAISIPLAALVLLNWGWNILKDL